MLQPRNFTVMAGKTDKKLDDIVAAIEFYRPDLPVERSPWTDFLGQSMAFFFKHLRH